MPLYEYECDACGERFERIQKFSDPPIQTCPTCGGAVHKLISSPAIQFKGSGWYVTDYARKDSASGKPPAEGASGAEKGDRARGSGAGAEKSAGAGAAKPAPAAAASGSDSKSKDS